VTRDISVTVTTTLPMIAMSVGILTGVPGGSPVTVSTVSCPGAPTGVWQLTSPAAGTSATFGCTYTATNGSGTDAIFKPSVFLYSSLAFTFSSQTEASTLTRSVTALGDVAFSVEPPGGVTARGTTSTIDIRSGNLDLVDRPATVAEILAHLSGDVNASSVATGTRTSLSHLLDQAAAAAAAGRTAAACAELDAFIRLVSARPGIPPALAAEWIATAERIRTTLGC
jgi:hypothetical protein